MDISLNSSSPEPTVSGVKSIFNKPENTSQGFDVTVDESVTAVPNNKTDLDLDTTTTEGNKEPPFKKSRKSIQQGFNVSSDESVLNSESEQSVTFAKPQPVFSKKRKSLIDFFNVSYNESLHPDDTGRSVDESNIFNRNPFKKSNESRNELSVREESSVQEGVGEVSVAMDASQRPESPCGLGTEADSTTFVTKENPFKKTDNQESSTQLDISVTEGNKTSEHQTMTDSRMNDEPDSDIETKSNPFKHKESSPTNNSISITDERSNVSTVENAVLAEPTQTFKNISLDRNLSKLTSKSTSYLEQSSINDDNLNNWMSDQSDEEVPPPPPKSPTVTANLSHTKEKPAVPGSPTAETNQLSVWEQKLNEIMSNAERKSKSSKNNIISPQKPKPLKKSDLNIEKPVEDVNKFKPPKLIKPAPFATKKLYEYIIKRLKPKYGIDTMLESENLMVSICDTVKKVTRRKAHQKRLIQNLKKEMAEAGLINTTMDFYEFVIKFLPYNFRVKVVPCVQPVTNVVYPPKDGLNPFDKIL